MDVGVDEAGQDQAAAWSSRGQPSLGRLGLHGDDAAVLDEQPVVGAEAHRRRIDVAPGRRGGEIEQVAADRDARRLRLGARRRAAWRSRRRCHENRVYTIGLHHDLTAPDPLLPPRRRRRGRRRRADAHRARIAARGRALHRHQGRLRRRRLRRLHRRDRRARAGRRAATTSSRAAPAQRQRLHPVPADARRQGALHGRRPARRRAATLHPVQQAMVDCHGSQCGFCTPGFVMSLWALYQHHVASGTRPTRAAIADALSGNLCRCTGYRPIIDAGAADVRAAAAPLDAAPVVRRAAGAARAARRIGAATQHGARASSRRARSTSFAAARARASATRARSPARPTSASGSPSSSASCRRCIYVGEVDELQAHRDARRRALRSAPARRSRTRGARSSRAGPSSRTCGRASPRCRSATPARWAATSPTARRSATRAGADRARRARSCCAAARASRRCRSTTSTSATEEPCSSRANSSQAIEVPLAARRRERPRATSSRSASTRTSRRSAPALAIELDADGTRRRGAASRSAAWRRPCGARRAPKPRSSAQPWNEATLVAAQRRARRATSRRSPTCAPAPPTACRSRRTCCAASGSRRAPTRRCRATTSSVWATRSCRVEPRQRRRRAHAMNRAARPALRSRRRRAARRAAAARVGVAVPHESAHLHVAGAAPYIDDMPELAGTLHAALGLSPVAHGAHRRARSRRASRALPGVVAVLTAADIPGANDCGPVLHDDPILADGDGALPRPAGVRGDRRDARRRAPRGGARRRRC